MAKYQRKSTLVFAVDLNHIEDLVQAFKEEGIDARGISSKTKSYERATLLNDFKMGGFPVLVNCGMIQYFNHSDFDGRH